jgi:hypothetical protein
MEAENYHPPHGFGSLLDSSGEPDSDNHNAETAALARLASTIHREGPHLDPKQLEQAIRWLKEWKFEKGSPLSRPAYGQGGFYDYVGEIRDGAEQVQLQMRALGIARTAHSWSAIAGASLCFSIFNLITGYSSWLISVAAIALAWWTYSRKCLPATREAALVWKEQDQRNLLTAVRSAETVFQCNLAGLFARVPENEMGVEIERFRDALYRDPDAWVS